MKIDKYFIPTDFVVLDIEEYLIFQSYLVDLFLLQQVQLLMRRRVP